MKTAITPTRAENFSEWYQNLITAADLAENAPVRGCMTIKPYGWAIWELMRDEMDRRIKAQGVLNANFPLLIPIDFFNREAEHVAGFAKEAAVVTHYRLKMIDGALAPDPESKLTEPWKKTKASRQYAEPPPSSSSLCGAIIWTNTSDVLPPNPGASST